VAVCGYDGAPVSEPRPTRRFSQAIAEGDGISVVAEVATPDDAAVAALAGADALIVGRDVGSHKQASDLPLLCRDRASAGADAYVVRASADQEELERLYFGVVDDGLECVVEVTDEEELELVLDVLDPEILLLSARDDDGEKLDHVLELLPDVPAGKLVIADAGSRHGDEIEGLERVGVDAVIVAASDVAALVGDEPPSV
jgi:NAD(P)H-dependent flavin oxidoreductase YrpB (nitropropane dioxygenase family)